MSDTERTAPYVVAIIEKDPVEHLPVVVHPHEVPILAAVHGEHKVRIDEDADLPAGVTQNTFEVEDEYARLEQRWGINTKMEKSFASLVFRDPGDLADYIDQTNGEELPKATAKPAAKRAAKAAKAATAKPAAEPVED